MARCRRYCKGIGNCGDYRHLGMDELSDEDKSQ